jgi:hypothetical protein
MIMGTYHSILVPLDGSELERAIRSRLTWRDAATPP